MNQLKNMFIGTHCKHKPAESMYIGTHCKHELVESM